MSKPLRPPEQVTIDSPNSSAEELPSLDRGKIIDDFLILKELGSGGSATVYLAQQLSLERKVALKISQVGGSEGKTLARLDHPNIMRVYSDGLNESTGLRLTNVEYIPGTSLGELLRNSVVSPNGLAGSTAAEEIIRLSAGVEDISPKLLRTTLNPLSPLSLLVWLAMNIAQGLEHAHEHGVIHLDVKPDNILLDLRGLPKLADFNVSSLDIFLQSGTPNTFGGTPAYMSPEQEQALEAQSPEAFRKLTDRTDIYSLAKVILKAAEKFLPENQFRQLQSTESPEDLSLRRCRKVLYQMLDLDPAKRPPAREVAQHFKAIFEFLQFDSEFTKTGKGSFQQRVVRYLVPTLGLAVFFQLYGQFQNHLMPPKQVLFGKFLLYGFTPVCLGIFVFYLSKVPKLTNLVKRRQAFVNLPVRCAAFAMFIWFLSFLGYRARLVQNSGHIDFLVLGISSVPLMLFFTARTFRKVLYAVMEIALPECWAEENDLKSAVTSDLRKLNLSVSVYRIVAIYVPLAFSVLAVLANTDQFSILIYWFVHIRSWELVILAAYQIRNTTKAGALIDSYLRALQNEKARAA